MDLVGDMLFSCLRQGMYAGLSPAQFRPEMRRRFSRLPIAGQGSFAWNCDRALNRFLDYPSWLRKGAKGFDLFHIIDHSYAHLVHALPAERTIVSCHDLDTFRCLLEPQREPRSKLFRQMTQRILDGLQRASHVLCDSDTVRREFLNHRLLPPEKVSVVLHGVHPSCSPMPDPAADAAASRLLPPYPWRLYLLNVGSTVPRKRIDVLLEVLAAVRKTVPAAHLVRVGGDFSDSQHKLVERLNLRDAISVLPFVSREVLAAMYRRAALLLQTSEAEGFGLPLVESMACGCPAVASDIQVLREIGGSAATFCPVADVATWSEKVIGLLQEKQDSVDAWETRRNAALNHAGSFTWERSAEGCVEIYRKVLGN